MAAKSIFSQIIDGEIESNILYEDNDFIVINDIQPQAPVHLLVITKKPYPTLEAVSPEDTKLHAGLLQVARKMAKKQGIADNYKLVMNVGKQMQAVYHIHLHVLGGWKNIDAAVVAGKVSK